MAPSATRVFAQHDHREAGVGVGDAEGDVALLGRLGSRLASSRVVVSGFSQSTPMPAPQAASAGPKWASLGVTMVR